MISLLGKRSGEGGGTMEIADGDHVTPYLLKERGYYFPRAVMRFTFKEGPHFSQTNGAALITVEWNEDWA